MKNRFGFTLIELLSVVLIIGILTAVGLPQYRRVVDKARVAEAQAMLGSINDSAERIAGEFGYRSFSAFAAAEPSKAIFTRLDMFDERQKPAGCSFSEDKKQLICSRFTYQLPSGNYVRAQVTQKGRLKGTVIALDTSSRNFLCNRSENRNEVCDSLGLDYGDVTF